MYGLFDPIALGPLTARNRLVRSATWLGLADAAGAVTEELLARYREVAAGGSGVVVTGYAAVSPEGRQLPRMLAAYGDDLVPGLTGLAAAIREQGALAGLQLVHAGGQTRSAWIDGRTPVAPAFVPSAQYPEQPRELTAEEIFRVVGDFGQAARRAREAGFDFVQLHAAHGYLINQFLSPITNQRSDRYGGSLLSRFRFFQEVMASVQAAAGPDFPFAVKLNATDFVPGGLGADDALRVAEWTALRGACFLEVSGGTPGSGTQGPVREVEAGRGEAYFADLAGSVKRRVSCPVSVVGGIRSYETAEELVMFGTVDLVSLARPLLREPDLPRRWQSGDRRPAQCASCSECFAGARKGKGVECVHRAALEDAAEAGRG